MQALVNGSIPAEKSPKDRASAAGAKDNGTDATESATDIDVKQTEESNVNADSATRYVAMYDYVATDEDELSIKENDVSFVL